MGVQIDVVRVGEGEHVGDSEERHLEADEGVGKCQGNVFVISIRAD